MAAHIITIHCHYRIGACKQITGVRAAYQGSLSIATSYIGVLSIKSIGHIVVQISVDILYPRCANV